jgi:integrase
MQGSIRKRSKASWQITIDIGRDPATGKRLRHFESVKGAKKDAQQRLAELLITIERGSYIKSPRTFCLADYLTEWLKMHAELRCRPRTVEGYRYIVNRHLIPELGRIRLSELRPQHIDTYCSKAIRRGLSNRTVLHDFRLLHKALQDAVKLGMIGTNSCDGVEPPRPTDKEMKFLRPEDVDLFLSSARQAPWPYYYLFYTMLFTGLRRSEALALKWANINIDTWMLSVTQTLHRLSGGKHVIQPPKTRTSRRQVTMPPSLALLLRTYREQTETQRLLTGKALRDTDFVFAHPDGTPLDQSTVTHVFRKVAHRAGFEGLRLHDLRHSYTSLMIAAGVNIKVISQSLGHANIGVTLDTYGHLLPSMAKTAAEQFDNLLKPWLHEENVGKMSADDAETDTRLEGFEPTTPGSEDRCSCPLSYRRTAYRILVSESFRVNSLP